MANEYSVTNLDSSGVLYDDRRDFYISPQVVKELWTDVAPFLTVVANQGTRSDLKDPLFKMFEHRNPWQKQKCYLNDASTSVIPDNDTGVICIVDGISGLGDVSSAWIGLIFEAFTDDATKTPLGRGVVVSIDGSTDNKFTMKNLSSTEFTIPDDGLMVCIGTAFEEGGSAPDAWSDELQVVWNSTQIFKTTVEITGTLAAAVLRGESSELARLRTQKSQEHKIQKERAFLFGEGLNGTNLDHGSDSFADSWRTINSGQVRTTYGLYRAVDKYGASSGDDQSKFTISEASYDYGNFVDDMEKVFQYIPDSGYKRAFCGAGALSYWSKMAGNSGFASNSGWTVNLGDMDRDKLGFNYRMLETPHGMLQLIPTPVLTRSQYNNNMLVVDDSNMFHAQYRAPKYQTNIKTDNAYDGVKDQYFSDEGIGVSLIESHKLFSITA